MRGEKGERERSAAAACADTPPRACIIARRALHQHDRRAAQIGGHGPRHGMELHDLVASAYARLLVLGSRAEVWSVRASRDHRRSSRSVCLCLAAACLIKQWRRCLVCLVSVATDMDRDRGGVRLQNGSSIFAPRCWRHRQQRHSSVHSAPRKYSRRSPRLHAPFTLLRDREREPFIKHIHTQPANTCPKHPQPPTEHRTNTHEKKRPRGARCVAAPQGPPTGTTTPPPPLPSTRTKDGRYTPIYSAHPLLPAHPVHG